MTGRLATWADVGDVLPQRTSPHTVPLDEQTCLTSRPSPTPPPTTSHHAAPCHAPQYPAPSRCAHPAPASTLAMYAGVMHTRSFSLWQSSTARLSSSRHSQASPRTHPDASRLQPHDPRLQPYSSRLRRRAASASRLQPHTAACNPMPCAASTARLQQPATLFLQATLPRPLHRPIPQPATLRLQAAQSRPLGAPSAFFSLQPRVPRLQPQVPGCNLTPLGCAAAPPKPLRTATPCSEAATLQPVLMTSHPSRSEREWMV